MSGWIAVEDALPKMEKVTDFGTHRSRKVIVYASGKIQFGVCYQQGDGFRWITDDADRPNVTHWMPLPARPYQKRGNG